MSCILPLYALNRPFIYAGRLRIFSRTDVFLQIYLKDLNSLSLHPRTAYYLESEEEYKTMHTYAPRNQFCHLMAYKYSEIDYHTTVPSHTAISVYQPSKQTNGLTPPSKGVAQIEETWKKMLKKYIWTFCLSLVIDMWTQTIRIAINDNANGLNRIVSWLRWLATFRTAEFRSPAEAGKLSCPPRPIQNWKRI